MKTAIVVDSGCHLPSSLCAKYHVSYVPLHYSVDEDSFTDECTDSNALAMFDSGALSLEHEVYVRAPTEEEFERTIVDKIKAGYESIIVQTASRQFSDCYLNACASMTRVKALLDGRPVPMRVLDSHAANAGQGLLVAETARRLLRSPDPSILQYELEKFASKTHTVSFAKDPMVAFERGPVRSDNKFAWVKAFASNKIGMHAIVRMNKDQSYEIKKVLGFQNACEFFFLQVAKYIQHELLSPIMTVNYCGSLEELKALPGFKALFNMSKAKKIVLIPTVASLSEYIQSGPGAISISFALDADLDGEK